MDPITGIGAAASIVQLLALCAKSAKAAKELWESYTDAPEELRQLAGKMEFLKFLLQQIEAFGGHLATENLDHLLPAVHRTIIMAALEGRAAQLERLRSLQRDHHTFRSRMRWAVLDKSKAGKVLKAVTDLEHGLSTCLVIVQTRLQTLNQSSMYQVMAAQTAMLPALKAASLQIQSSIQSSSDAYDTTREKIEETSALVRKDIHVLQDRQLQGLDQNATTLKAILQTVTELKSTTTTATEYRKGNIDSEGSVPYHYPPRQGGLGNHQFDIERITQDNNTNRVVAQHSWTYRWTDDYSRSPPVSGSEGSPRIRSVAAAAEFESKAYRKKLRARVRVWFGLFGPRVAEFEFAVHIRSKAWLSPTVEVAVRSVNIRP
ncbi:uncharacterized protein B0H64DRAFT_203125 [Chaetomium fimeti]|uniref:Fungal N-terminal domain-containing protein n=1 Tax=Chaetomium fimeti TaxID=1854472 RepID=A0AAE0HAD9_9PEZI|nr:hypothetical protein B0H64DRAFT_203125 [Chaetomium fimeti]